jgi:hypothetical protein
MCHPDLGRTTRAEALIGPSDEEIILRFLPGMTPLELWCRMQSRLRRTARFIALALKAAWSTPTAAPLVEGLLESHKEGDPFCNPLFVKLA